MYYYYNQQELCMKVLLVSHTQNPEYVCAQAGKVCYSPYGLEEIQKRLQKKEYGDFLENIIRMGHLSVIEHAGFSFMLEGVSRACSHQLVRHRLASYSQKSQRYVNEKQFEYITPPSITAEAGLNQAYARFMEHTQVFYSSLLQSGIPAEDARFVLPNAAETKIFVSMNGRELLHFFEKRLCRRAQWEIRAAAERMLALVLGVAPHMFKTAGPGCVHGACPEGKLTCGKASEMREKYNRRTTRKAGGT
jgi:thymidylate synthase (FAD)